MPRHKSKPLTPEQRTAMWELYTTKNLTMQRIADTFHVSISVVHRAIHTEKHQRQLAS